jgi:hypothetical protein
LTFQNDFIKNRECAFLWARTAETYAHPYRRQSAPGEEDTNKAAGPPPCCALVALPRRMTNGRARKRMSSLDQEPIDNPTAWVAKHIRRYVETNGEDGHIWHGVPSLLLTTVGRRSGKPRRSALYYAPPMRLAMWWSHQRAAPTSTLIGTATCSTPLPSSSPSSPTSAEQQREPRRPLRTHDSGRVLWSCSRCTRATSERPAGRYHWSYSNVSDTDSTPRTRPTSAAATVPDALPKGRVYSAPWPSTFDAPSGCRRRG